MRSLQVEIRDLPAAPLDAAADFHARQLPKIRDDRGTLGERDLMFVFEPAGHEHRAWRLSAIQDLARELAPKRVNGIVGSDDAAVAGAIAYLDGAPGVTGQLLAVER